MHNDAHTDFQVKILMLKPGKYTYSLVVSDSFFAAFEHSIVQRGALEAIVLLEKSETLIRANFNIKGTIELESDRTLELFDYPITVAEQLIYKFGDDDKELSEEMFQISWETPTLDLAQPIYEFINLAVPMRKLAPGEEHEPEGTISDDERRLVYRSAPSTEEEVEPEPDPQWEALRRLFPN
jgi:uncharacterized metal-binding protein YceD (DUF177 family)